MSARFLTLEPQERPRAVARHIHALTCQLEEPSMASNSAVSKATTSARKPVFYSITSSAVTSRWGGTSRPTRLGSFKLVGGVLTMPLRPMLVRCA